MEEKILRTEEAQKLAKDLVDKYEIEKLTEMVKDNKISFVYKEKEYRVSLLDQKRKDELDLMRRKKYSELLQAKDEKGNSSFLFIKELIELYKERGIDIDEIDDKIKKLQTEIKDKQMKLGEALEKDESDSILNTYKNEISELIDEIYILTIQKSTLLENSFEKALENYVIKFLSWLSLERKENETYIKAFDSIEDYLKSDDELISKSITYAIELNY